MTTDGIRPNMFDVQQRRLAVAQEAAIGLNLMLDNTPFSYSDFQRFKEQGILAPDVAEFMTDCEETVGRFMGRSAMNDTLYNDGSRQTLSTLEPWTEAAETALKDEAQLERDQENITILTERFHELTEPVATGFADKLPATRRKKWGRSETVGQSIWSVENKLRGVTHSYTLDYEYDKQDQPYATAIRCDTEKTPGYPVTAMASLGMDGRVNHVSVDWAPRSPGAQERAAIDAMDSTLADRIYPYRLVSISLGSDGQPAQICTSHYRANDTSRIYRFDPSQNAFIDGTNKPTYSPEDAMALTQEMLRFLPTVKAAS